MLFIKSFKNFINTSYIEYNCQIKKYKAMNDFITNFHINHLKHSDIYLFLDLFLQLIMH